MFDQIVMDNWYLRSIVINWERVFPSPVTGVLILVSMIVLWTLGRRRKPVRFLVLYSLVFLFIYLFPPAVYVLRRLMRYGHVYWRMFWIFPWSVLIAAAVVLLAERLKEKSLKIAVIAMAAVLIVISGNQVYIGNDRAYHKAANREKVPAEAYETVAMIYENEGVEEKASVRIAVPPDLTPYIRQLDGTIGMPFGRNIYPPETPETLEEKMLFCLRGDEAYKPMILDLVRETECRYVLVHGNQGFDNYLQAGARLIGTAGEYELWEVSA